MARARTRYSVRRTAAEAGTDIYDRNFDAIAEQLDSLSTSLEWVMRGGPAGGGGAGGGGGAPVPPSPGVLAGYGIPTRLAYWNGNYSLSSDADGWWDALNHRLGIGTNSPLYKAHVQASGDALYAGPLFASMSADAQALLGATSVMTTLSRSDDGTFAAGMAINEEHTSNPAAPTSMGFYGACLTYGDGGPYGAGILGEAIYAGTGTQGFLFGSQSACDNYDVGTVTVAASYNAGVVGNFGGGAIGTAYGFRAPAGHDATNVAGIAVEDQTADTNATNLLLGTLSPPVGTWSIYNVSTRNNAIAGPVYLGLSSSATGTLKFISALSAFTTGLLSGVASASVDYKLPTAAPVGDGYGLVSTIAGQWSWAPVLTTSTGAPIGAAYVTIGNDATLTNERALTAGTGISLADGGANSSITVANTGVLSINGTTGAYTGSALTKTDDTNVTLTLGGTPATALLRAVSLTVGWTGTLSTARGGTGNSALAALTKADDTNVTVTLGGSPSTALVNAASITMGWTGTLAVARGGTGLGTITQNGVMYGNGTGAVGITAQGGTNTILTASAGAPSFSATPIVNTSVQIGVVSTATGSLKLGNASSANLTTIQGGNASNGARTYVMPVTDPTGTQALSGSLSGSTVTLGWSTIGAGSVTGSGTATQIAYWSGTSALTGSANVYWDNSNQRFGINSSSPIYDLHVFGGTNANYTQIRAEQTNTARSAYIVAITGSIGLNYGSHGSTFSTAGIYRASGGSLECDGSGGLCVAASGAAGVMGLYTGGTADANKRVGIDASGNVTFDAAAGTPALLWDQTNKRLILGSATGSYPLHVKGSANAGLAAAVSTSSTGAAAYSAFILENSSHLADIFLTSTGYTTSGVLVADQGAFYTTGAGGILLASDNAAGSLTVTTGGFAANQRRMLVDVSGNLTVGNTTTTTASKTTIQTRDSGTATTLEALRLQRLTSGTAAAALGVFQTAYLDNASATAIEAARVTTKWNAVGATAATETATWVLNTMNNGSNVDRLTVNGLRVASATSAVLDAFAFANGTVTVTGSTAITTAAGFNYVSHKAPLFNTAATITNAAHVYIDGPPTITGGGAITNAYPLWVDSGRVRVDGVQAVVPTATLAVSMQPGSSPTTGPGANPTIVNWLPIDSDGALYWIPLFQ